MATREKFALNVKDVFRFKNGQTILVGPIETDQSFIGPQKCELLVDGVHRQILRIEGEMIPNVPDHKKYRSLSSKEPINLGADELEEHNVILQSCNAP